MKRYMLLVVLLFVLGSTAVASPFMAEARETLLKCAFKEVKPELVDRAYDKVRENASKSSRAKSKESLEDAVVREGLECAIKTIDSMLTYRKLLQ